MADLNHKIKKLIFELELLDVQEKDGYKAIEDFKTHFYSDILPELEKHLDSQALNIPDLTIDQLEITIDNSLPGTLPDLIIKALENKLSSFAEAAPSISLKNGHLKKSRYKARHAALGYYFERGYLPWNFSDVVTSPSVLLNELLVDNKQDVSSILRNILAKPGAVNRLILQFHAEATDKIIEKLAPELIIQLQDLIKGLNLSTKALLQTAGYSSVTELKHFLQEIALKITIENPNVNPADVQNLFYTELNKVIADNATSIEHKEISKIIAGNNIGNHKEPSKIITGNNTSAKHKGLNKITTNNNTADSKELSQKPTVITTEENIIDQEEAADEIYINNAGIILLWPYLQMFFQELKLYKNGIFLKREKAIHILHYLCFETEYESDHIMVLNKLLCGADIDQPIERFIKFTKKEKQECENMLQAVINNWPLLKNTSVNGLRVTFLQRPGVLTRVEGEGNWQLKVERKAFDVILDQLPWGISTIKLEWNLHVIFTEW